MHYGVEHNISMELYKKYQEKKTREDQRTSAPSENITKSSGKDLKIKENIDGISDPS